jgi:hypothetical protein
VNLFNTRGIYVSNAPQGVANVMLDGWPLIKHVAYQIDMLEIQVNGDHCGVGVMSGAREFVIVGEQVVLQFVNHRVVP